MNASSAPAPCIWVSTWGVRCGIAEYSALLLRGARFNPVQIWCDHRTKAEKGPGVEVRPSWSAGQAEGWDKLAHDIKKRKPRAVIIQHHPGLVPWGGLASFLDGLKGLPVIITLHNVAALLDEPSRQEVAKSLRQARRVLVHTAPDVQMLRTLGVQNVTLFPHGAIGHGLKARPTRVLNPQAAPLIGAYGFFLPHKGFLGLMEAFARLRKTWPKARLRLITAEYPVAESRQEIEKGQALLTRESLHDVVEWKTDFLPNEESLALLNPCDLLVLPYHDTNESASGAIRNALASRAPVMVSPIRIFDELGGAVIRMRGSDAGSIKQGVEDALHDKALRQRTVRNARLWLQRHDWGLMAQRLCEMVSP